MDIMLIAVLFVAFIALIKARRSNSKIVGGSDISLTEIPFMASLEKKDSGHFCVGSLITLKDVLTGCHCLGDVHLGTKHDDIVLEDVSIVYAVAGIENVISPSPDDPFFQRRPASKLIIHPKCDGSLILEYDFGIVHLTTPFKQTTKVKPFKFDSNLIKSKFGDGNNLLIPEGERCYIAGWGVTALGNTEIPKHLKSLRMKVISDRSCRFSLGKRNPKFANYNFAEHAQICAVGYDFGKNESSCRGDSGGPFFCNNTVYATVSYGFDCGKWDTPGVYAKVSSALEWIEQNVKTEESTPRKQSFNRVSNIEVRLFFGLPQSCVLLVLLSRWSH